MTTKVQVKIIEGNKAVMVSTYALGDDEKLEQDSLIRNGFTILKPGESAEFLVYDGQQIAVRETGEFLS